MPLYVYRCDECDIQFEHINKVEDRYDYCPICTHSCERIPSFRGSIHVFQPYFNESLGKHITGAHQLRDEFKRQNLVPLYPGDTIDPRKAAKDRKKQIENESRKSVQKFLQSGIADLINDSEPIPKIKETIEREKILDSHGVTGTRNWEDT